MQRTITNDLTRDEMEFFGSGYHPVIRELIATHPISTDPRWIANKVRPKITVEQAKTSIELLLRLGYIECDQDNRMIATKTHIRTLEGANHLSVHKYHQEMLQLSARSLSEVEFVERDLSALTANLSLSQIPRVKQTLKDLRKQIIELSEESPQEANVHQLNIQLFPVTERERK